MTWRTRIEAAHPDWLPFLEAVSSRAADDSLQEGDEGRASKDVLADQAGATAAVLLFGVELMDATREVEAIERVEGRPVSSSDSDREQIQSMLQELRDDPALMEAFDVCAHLLPEPTRMAVLTAVDGAEALEPLYSPTRSRLKINAREAAPAIAAAMEERLAPIWRDVRALEEQFASLATGDDWKLEALLVQRDRLRDEVARIEREILVDTIVEATPDGQLVRIHRALEAFRARSDEDS